MKLKSCLIGTLLLLGAVAQPAFAKEESAPSAVTNPDVGFPVFPYDITDRPYEVLGTVEAKVRKATIFSKDSSQEKIYRELWERGKKMGADAVIKAEYGKSHVTAMSWGSTTATGIAIKFKPAAAVAPAAVAIAAPVAQ